MSDDYQEDQNSLEDGKKGKPAIKNVNRVD